MPHEVKGSESRDATADDIDLVRRARADAVRRVRELGRPDLADDAALVVSELVTNAILHGGGCTGIEVVVLDGGLRIEVRDGSRVPPLLGRPSEESLTGRGLRLVARLSEHWGAHAAADEGKVVWAQLTGRARPVPDDEGDLLDLWGDDWELDGEREPLFHVELGDVPTDLLLAAKSHVDNVVREFTLAAAGAATGTTAELPPHLGALLRAVVGRFSDARLAIKRQALDADRRGDARTRLALDLPASAADAAEEYAAALDEVDAYCRARRLLTLETPSQHRAFRHWYVEEVVTQLRAAATGRPTRPPLSFERRLLAELDRVAGALRAGDRAARLYAVTAALATAATPEAVASAALDEGAPALGAAGGGVQLATAAARLALPGAVGYDESVLDRLRNESVDAELPAALAFRTGEPVWLESRSERDQRFPALAGIEATAAALCAVPLETQGRRLGALWFSFTEARLFDEDERRFVLALAAQTAQALDRAQLQQTRIDVSRRLQRSLLPPSVPEIPGLDVAAIYHPFGDGVDVGGDFYDVWPVGPERWAIAAGDASGTGPEAAALSALVRHTLRALAVRSVEPAEVMLALNTALLHAAPDDDGERFCTVVFGVVNTGATVDVRVASGGHPPPVLRRAGGATSLLPVAGGSLLGLFAEIEVRTATVRLDRGDTLLLLTDGVLEARRDGRQFGVEGVLGLVAGLDGGALKTAEAVEQAVLRHTGGSLSDDMAAVVLHLPRR